MGLYTVLWGSTEVGGNCVRKDGGQYTFEWLCADKYGTITLAQSDNIKNCYTCFLKKFSDWTWEQEKRLGIREDQSISHVVDTKECKQRTDNKCVYTKEQTIHIR